jgi:hypothetical protein
MHPKLLALSMLVAVGAGTAGTVCIEAGLHDQAMLALLFLIAGLGGIVASAAKMR